VFNISSLRVVVVVFAVFWTNKDKYVYLTEINRVFTVHTVNTTLNGWPARWACDPSGNPPQSCYTYYKCYCFVTK